MRRARGRYWLVLNSDTVVQPRALAELVRFMEAHTKCGIAGPRLVHPDGGLQPTCRNFPNAVTHFLEASGLWQLFRGNRFVGRWYYLCSPHDRTQEVDWLTGACLIVRPAVAAKVGLFDEVLYSGMYGEDLDWCWRIKHCGWRILFDPQAVVAHVENASPLDDRALRMYEGFYAFCGRYYLPWQQVAMRAATVLALFPRWLFGRGPRRSLYRALMALPLSGTGRTLQIPDRE
jgi:hypothetical protein